MVSLVVEDGSGLDNSNGLISVADANAYCDGKSYASAWNDISGDTGKSDAIIEGTAYVENRYRGRWRGTRAYEDQALSWPRIDVVDEDGFDVADDEVPQRVKDAVCEAALRVIQGVDLYRDYDPTSPASISKQRVVGPISKSDTYATPARDAQPLFAIIDDLLWALTLNQRTNFLLRA